MKILVDADACPNVIKDILFRAAERTETLVVLVANQRLNIPPSPYIKMVKVASGFDVADNEIVQQAQVGDLIITADIPLADLVVKKNCIALNPRGELYTEDNIRQRLAMRDLMEQIRDTGVLTGGPNSFSKKDRQAFANQLDRYITQSKHT